MKTLSTTCRSPLLRLLLLFLAFLLCAPFALADDDPAPADPETPYVYVTNIVAHQRYPWNGFVDIDYEVVASDPDADVWVWPQGLDNDMNVSMAPRALSGDGVNAPVKPGTHRMTWNVSSDYPTFNSSSFIVKMSALTGGAPYMVIDISGGVDAISYPVTYLGAVPEGGWTDEYKTSKIVLRLCPPGTFMMGTPADEVGHNFMAQESQHLVTLTKPFYMGVFEVTQKQFQLVTGSTPASYKGDTRPVERVSYNTIRGDLNGSAWPTHNQVEANTFMGRLRSKANVLADLPTEAQWEYACRAGTGTALNSGKNITSTTTCPNVAEVGRYYGNNSDGKGGYSQHTAVGSYLPNAWGIYDMHGNVAELCLDWWNSNLGTSAVTDPVGPSSGSYRLVRGGCWYGASWFNVGWAATARSGYRFCGFEGGNTCGPGNTWDFLGFRLAITPVE
jgi:formylglycine-generating enzyme required for sulfatase activity